MAETLLFWVRIYLPQCPRVPDMNILWTIGGLNFRDTPLSKQTLGLVWQYCLTTYANLSLFSKKRQNHFQPKMLLALTRKKHSIDVSCIINQQVKEMYNCILTGK